MSNLRGIHYPFASSIRVCLLCVKPIYRTQRNIHQIELAQRRAAGFNFRDYSNFTRVTLILKQLGGDTLEQSRLWYQLSMFYKIQQGLVGISLPSEVCPLTRASRAPNAFPFRQSFTPTVMFVNVRFIQIQ